jgi:hypothetical protein
MLGGTGRIPAGTEFFFKKKEIVLLFFSVLPASFCLLTFGSLGTGSLK